MGIKQVIADDLTGKELPDDTKPTTVKVGSDSYEVYLGDESLETFLAMLSGNAPLLAKATPAPKSTTSSTGGTGQKTETYGYDYAAVKAWAIANGIKGKTGTPVREETTRIGQTVYDQYHEQHKVDERSGDTA